jgi:hypothetical protein
MGGGLTIELGWPARALSPNSRAHWAERHRFAKAAKDTAYWALREKLPPCFKHNGARMSLTIIAHPPSSRTRDDDNLIASFKPFRDGLALALGCDDSLFDQQPIQWAEPCKPGKVIVCIGGGE